MAFRLSLATIGLGLFTYGAEAPAEPDGKADIMQVTMQGQGWFFAKRVEVEMMHGPAHAPWVRPSEIKSGIRTSGSVNVGIIDISSMGTMQREMQRIQKSGPAPRVLPAGLPGVQLRLRLTNHGSEPAIIEVLDFNSTLGNFVVRPAKCTVPAGGSIEVELMSSQLGGAAAEIPSCLPGGPAGGACAIP